MGTSVTTELLGEIEAALASEIDVDKRYVRLELFDQPKRLGTVCRDADDIHPFSLQERAGALKKELTVVDD
jgi:hypothetical protein